MIASKQSFPRMLYLNQTEEYKAERELEYLRRQKRMQTLMHWTKGVLEKLHLQSEADLFSFSCQPLDVLTPTELFFGEHWYIPLVISPSRFC